MKATVLIAVTAVTIGCSEQSTLGPSQVPLAGSGGIDAVSVERRFATLANPHETATVQFRSDVTDPFSPQNQVIPNTVVIRAGGTVTFDTSGFVELAIYGDGKEPEDINTSVRRSTPCPGFPNLPGWALIRDPDNLLAIFDQPCAGGPTSPSYTFVNPGRYLVMSTFVPHFDTRMWGWVVVHE